MVHINFKLLIVAIILSLTSVVLAKDKKPYIITTSTTLASLTKEVVKGWAKVDSLAKGYEDLHYMLARPDFIVKLNKADMFIINGADLEVGWVPLLLKKSRNRFVQQGAKGYFDSSKTIKLIDKPEGRVTRASGDVHLQGNPHFLLDPVRALLVTQNIAKKIKQLYPSKEKFIDANFNTFKEKIKILLKEVQEKLKKISNKKIVTYHSDFNYFVKRFPLKIITTIEEKPGVPPSLKYIKRITSMIKNNHIKILAHHPYDTLRYSKKLAKKTGAKIVIFPGEVYGQKHINNYFKFIREYADLFYKFLK